MLPKIINIDEIKPAPYNPRKISEKQFDKLKDSIKKLGIVIPILVNKQNNMIVAGHQRSKAAKAIGIKQIPAFFVDGISKYDEARFNQFHNSTDDFTFGKGTIDINVKGFNEVDPEHFKTVDTNGGRIRSICKVLLKYGNLLSCVVKDNKIIYNVSYVKACQLLDLKVNTYGIGNSDIATDDENLLNANYGSYSYDNLPKNTFVQGLAQKRRLAWGKTVTHSHLYEYLVKPYLNEHKNANFLDFGAGKCKYANLLKGTPLEFYPHYGNKILYPKAMNMIDKVKREFEEQGRYDFVVCDSVVNSTNSMEAEIAVLRCLSVFSNGPIFISGRTVKKVIEMQTNKYTTEAKNWDYFLDENNFTSSFRKGQWYYQHFHTRETIEEELKKVHLKIVKYREDGSSFQIMAIKTKELSLEEAKSAIDYEFNLPLPNNKRYKQNKEMWDLVKRFYK